MKEKEKREREKIGGLAGGGYRVDGWADGRGKEGVGRLDQWRERGSSWVSGSCTERERERGSMGLVQREREREID